jgi:steroid delta-isomerase-like uncharacterized protein
MILFGPARRSADPAGDNAIRVPSLRLVPGEGRMSVAENKALVQRRYDEIENRHNIEAADELMAVDYVHHDPVLPPEMQHSRKGFKQLAMLMLSAVPDLQTTVHELIAEGDKVAARLSHTGTHKGELLGVAPTGRRVELSGLSIHRIADGKLAEGWVSFDVLGMLRQMGARIEPDA